MTPDYWKQRYGSGKTPKDDPEPRKKRIKFKDNNPELYDKTLLKELRLKLISIYGESCMKCAAQTKIVIDHIKSRFNGGTNDLDNLQLLCWNCNKAKGHDEIDYRS